LLFKISFKININNSNNINNNNKIGEALSILGSGKRGRPSQESGGKDELMIQISEELEGCKLKLINTNLPNVMQQVVDQIDAFKTAYQGDTDYLKTTLTGDSVSQDDLQKLHSASLTRNIEWKTKQLAMILFKIHFNNAMMLQTRSKLCEAALVAVAKEIFTDKYWKDGSYQHTSFTDDILSIIKSKSKDEGMAEARGQAADAAM
jgi:hypothetical protein